MVFVKRGDRVDAEAAALAAAAPHPGVVEPVGVVDGALHTRRVDATPLADTGPLTPDEVAGVAAAVASTLADLHDRDVVHGGLDATHVLLTADGRPVLCSLGRGGDPADDVAALGRLVADLLAAGRAEPARPPGRRPPWPPRRGRRLGPMLAPQARPVLAGLAADASHPDPHHRPAARAFATAVRQQVPAARLPRPAGRSLLAPAPGPEDRRAARAGGWRTLRPKPPARAAAGATAAALVAAAAWWALAASGPTPAGEPRVAAGPAAPPTTGPATAPPPAAGPTAAPAAPMATRVWPEEPVALHDGVLSHGGARYAVGEPGDAVVAGDWACRGRRTVALLRPATGEVFAFDGWAAEGRDLVARPLGRVDGATAVRVEDADGDGCDDLRVERRSLPPVTVEVHG